MTNKRFSSLLRGGKKTFGQVTSSVSEATSAESNHASKQKLKIPEDNLQDIQVLPEYLAVKDLINENFPLIFVTGGAGTGKSTFIRWLDNEFAGKTLICAPTGIAALTISGKTIHSLCRFPPSWIIENDIKLYPKSLAKHAKILIIDEVSMVDANVLDSINKFFQLNRDNKKPFGGITVVMVGDLFQLPPIVTKVTRPLFNATYRSPKFFAAHAISESKFHAIILTKAFRQTDQLFVELLANIREGKNLKSTLNTFNTACKITNEPPEGAIWLAPRHIDVDRVNDERLKKLPGKIHVFNGEITGKFSEKQLPVPNKIELKIGAQVLIAKNSSKYVNGDVATVTEIFSDRIKAMLASTKKIVEVPINMWEQFDYKFNEETGTIERIVIGTYRQLPAVLAWAITIHKSQGLTLDRVHLDLGQGAFETGQTYVALSRCRSLETLTLSKAIQSSDIKVDPESTVFYSEIKK